MQPRIAHRIQGCSLSIRAAVKLLDLLEQRSAEEGATLRIAQLADLIKSEYFRLSGDDLSKVVFRSLLGASGITLEYSPLRHANNLESVLTYEGTSEMHLLSIGRALTGQAAFR